MDFQRQRVPVGMRQFHFAQQVTRLVAVAPALQPPARRPPARRVRAQGGRVARLRAARRG
jgi:hypothetical protein